MSEYCWVVICKNHRFHNRENVFFGHQIVLGETDAISERPSLEGELLVRCDDCGKEYSYRPSEVLRAQVEYPGEFTPHPRFR